MMGHATVRLLLELIVTRVLIWHCLVFQPAGNPCNHDTKRKNMVGGKPEPYPHAEGDQALSRREATRENNNARLPNGPRRDAKHHQNNRTMIRQTAERFQIVAEVITKYVLIR